jgi:hypothetical protein
MYNPTNRKTILPKISGPKVTKLKPVLIAKVYQNTLNRTMTEIAQNINPHPRKPLSFHPQTWLIKHYYHNARNIKDTQYTPTQTQ